MGDEYGYAQPRKNKFIGNSSEFIKNGKSFNHSMDSRRKISDMGYLNLKMNHSRVENSRHLDDPFIYNLAQ